MAMNENKVKRVPSMVQVGDVIVSVDCLTERFCCDLDACHGICCVEGEAGAPVTMDEVSAAAQAVIDKQGVAYTDSDGDLVTSIVNGKDCVFTCYEDGCCFCAAERAFRAGRTAWCKPVSCALYPIREQRLSNGLVALNYHRWDVCRPAVKKGKMLDLPVYRFLREPLERRFGKAWYAELEEVASALHGQGYI